MFGQRCGTTLIVAVSGSACSLWVSIVDVLTAPGQQAGKERHASHPAIEDI
jgi:hypothetical protein